MPLDLWPFWLILVNDCLDGFCCYHFICCYRITHVRYISTLHYGLVHYAVTSLSFVLQEYKFCAQNQVYFAFKF